MSKSQQQVNGKTEQAKVSRVIVTYDHLFDPDCLEVHHSVWYDACGTDDAVDYLIRLVETANVENIVLEVNPNGMDLDEMLTCHPEDALDALKSLVILTGHELDEGTLRRLATAVRRVAFHQRLSPRE